MELKLSQIAEMLGGVYEGNPETIIRAVGGIEDAATGDITFLANKKYFRALSKTKASAVIVAQKQDIRIDQIIVADPYAAFGKMLSVFYPQSEAFAGISDKAFVEDGASIEEGATIFPFVCVRSGASIGKRSVLYPGVYIGAKSKIGNGCVLHANIVIHDGCVLGNRVTIHAGSVIGSDGFGFAQPGITNTKIPQIGFVEIEDDCEIGANVTIDRGTIGKTLIEKNVKIDNLVQIAHNVTVGTNTVIAAQTGVAGSASIGASNIIGGQVGIIGHIKIADNVMIAGRSGVHKNLAPFSIVAGAPQREHQRWLRTEAVISRLPELKEKVDSLQQQVLELEEIIKKIKTL